MRNARCVNIIIKVTSDPFIKVADIKSVCRQQPFCLTV